jgi:uncharacterized protein (DUF58 family)
MSTSPTKDDPRKFLDPRTLAKVRSLELKARLIVEGYLSGQHKSPYHGFSVEFAQHREYVPGDDIKHVDWKVWGRTGRFYLKQYEEETNLVCWIMLDTSESMKYGSIDGMSKFDYACLAAAALATASARVRAASCDSARIRYSSSLPSVWQTWMRKCLVGAGVAAGSGTE